MEKSLDDETRCCRTFLAEYYGQDNGRTAQIYTTWRGLSVSFLKDGEVVEKRNLYEHNRIFAEEACDNWIMGIIK